MRSISTNASWWATPDRFELIQLPNIEAAEGIEERDRSMAEGGWIVLSAAVGAAGSIITTWLNALFAKGRPDYFDKIAVQVLKTELKGKGERSVKELANIIGLPEKETKELLLIAGATGNKEQPLLWAIRK
jgi:hypothetical protein